jgi:hypothetical protein
MGNPASKVPMTSVGGISVTGGSFPARIWRDFNQPAHTLSAYKAFPSCTSPRAGRDLTKFFTGGDDEETDGSLDSAVCPDGYLPADLDGDGAIESCVLIDTPAATPPPATTPPPPPTTSPPQATTVP